ncbi:aldo/keto reductase [Megasphaera massiliensis]|uniref:aldo/keto reductase n=2 Tax=Megasphaera massiliensis TaxID=1232428 RepID=UPI00040072C0|nr:aldo/keto reductase [Megasphaera massiliensis]MBS6256022.1 aldo/keto reductase [Megasphaera sp.]
MEFVTLNNGIKMPKLGYGVYQTDPADTERAVSDALEVGYRLIDTAAIYGNEEGVGAAIRQSGIAREDLFITTKLWVQDHGYDNTLRAFDASMKRLGLDYLDLYLIHKPYGDYYGAWRAMEKLYKEGRIRAIGVTSFWNERLADLAGMNEVKPAVNQIETNVWNQKWSEEAFMKEIGIQPQAWAPFAEGNNDIFRTPLIQKIAETYGKTVGQVMLRWLLQRDIVAIPKSVRKERMQENFDIFDFELTSKDMEALRTLDTGKSTIYDEMDPHVAMNIGKVTFHD